MSVFCDNRGSAITYMQGNPMVKYEREYIKSLIQHAEESDRLFQNEQKPNREKMVCRGLLRCLGISFSEVEILVGSHEPIDVAFRSAAFQITEILDAGTRRSWEYRDRTEKLRGIRAVADITEPWES